MREETALSSDRFGTGMNQRFGLLYYLSGFAVALRRMRMEQHSAERIRKAAQDGNIVYALHTPSLVDWVALNQVLLNQGLPLPIYTHGVRGGWLGPMGEWLQRVWGRFRGGPAEDPIRSGWLAQRIAEGKPSCVFLARKPELNLPFSEPPEDPLEALEQAQARSERPVLVLPVVVLWEKARPEGVVGEFVAGLEELPGPFSQLWSLSNASDPLVQVGEPVSLAEIRERFGTDTPSRQRRRLRLLLRRYLYREAQVVLGPRTRAWGEVRRQVLQSPELSTLISQQARATGSPPATIASQIGRSYDRMAARFSGSYLRLAAWITRQIWQRIYSGIDIRPEDLERVREAMRKGTPVLVPCHRSHLDYMLLSSILYDHDIAVPHVVAGDNLAFWPLGAVFRRMGAFFIRRNFAGDTVFPVLFARYLKELLRMEVPVEFFIEGGRSRTGKLLSPKLGVLRMVVEAAVQSQSGRDVSLLPIYIGYARVAEEKVFERELSGSRKEPESIQGVVKATRVLRERYGRVYVRVGEAISAKEAAGSWLTLTPEEKLSRLQNTGDRLLARIDEETLILPVALTSLAILAHGRRGIRHEDLLDRAARFLGYLRSLGVKEPPGLRRVAELVDESTRVLVASRMLEAHEGDGARVYAIPPRGRIRMEYYKNTLLAPLATLSWYSSGIRALGQDVPDLQEVDRLFDRQAEVFSREFIFDPDQSVALLRQRAREKLVEWELMVAEGDQLRVRDRSRIGELANLSTNLLESYLLVLRVLEKGATDVPKAALALGKTLLAVDELQRPEALNLQNLQHAAKTLGRHPNREAVRQDLSILLDGKA